MTTSEPTNRTDAIPARCAIGLDVGGTKIAGAVVTEHGHVLDYVVIPTPTGLEPHLVPDALKEFVQQLRGRHPEVEAIGVGAAGIVEWPTGLIRWAPNNTYRELPLRELLTDATGLPTTVDNDANAAAWAEARLGASAARDNMVFLTIGTGIGGGLILNGQLYRGRTGMATELGHMIVDPHGDPCGCGNNGCLEAMASGSALERLGRQAIVRHPNSLLAELATQNNTTVTGHMIYTAAQVGDPVAHTLFDRVGYWLGVGLASMLNIFEVDAVIIGDGLGETGALLLDPTRTSLQQFIFAKQYRPIPPIQPGSFGTQAGVVGAAHLALHG
jgi:glucokinase